MYDLIHGGDTVVYTKEGEFAYNDTVLASHEETDNEDGSKTFTVKIKQGLTYNNGEPSPPRLLRLRPGRILPGRQGSGSGMVPLELVGAAEYQNGDVNYISGLRLVDEYTYAITVSADVLPYYYEETYANLKPLYLPCTPAPR